MRRLGLELFLLASLLLTSNVCFGQVEAPTDPEFLAWPSYCQARFVTLQVGEQTQWAYKVPRVQIELAKREIGEQAFLSIHHACAGSMWLQRARMERDKVRRSFMLNQSITETTYTVLRIPESSPLLPGLYSNLAAANKELGNTDVAIGHLERAIALQPTVPATYVSLGLLYRSLGQLPKAREIFQRGSDATGEQSAELHYHFGLLLLQLKDNGPALQHAKLAYARGFPLPGLRNKLMAQGLWDGKLADSQSP